MIKMSKDKGEILRSIKYNNFLYHNNCYDGFTSYILARNTNILLHDVKIIPLDPNIETPPKINPEGNTLIVDLGLKIDVLKNIINNSKITILVDHHVSNYKETLNLMDVYNDKFVYYYNVDRCGCSLLWCLLYPESPIKYMSKFIKLIEDNDIGKWKNNNSINLILGLQTYLNMNHKDEKNCILWNDYIFNFNESFTKFLKKGKECRDYFDYLVNKKSLCCEFGMFPSKKYFDLYKNDFIKEGQYKVAIIQGREPDVSQISRKILSLKNCDLCLFYSYSFNKKIYSISLRSINGLSSKIAKIMGGGGHADAAAFNIKDTNFSISSLFTGEYVSD